MHIFFFIFIFKTAYVTDTFKQVDPSSPSNHRSISLTATTCKPMEAITKDTLCSALLTAGRIYRHQHDFIIKHSTVANRLAVTYD